MTADEMQSQNNLESELLDTIKSFEDETGMRVVKLVIDTELVREPPYGTRVSAVKTFLEKV